MRSAFFLTVFLSLTRLANAQTPTLTVASAALNIDPTATDSYTLQGAFTGLDLNSARSVTLQVGPFSATIPMSGFVQQPSNVFTYTDSTGKTPYWISSLTIDNNAKTFTAQATKVVLAGIENPFAVQLGTDKAIGCSMARVQLVGPGAYQLTSGDGANEPCQIANVVAEPPVAPVGEQANVTFTVTPAAGANFDPATLQLFRADDNAQPVGAALCSPSDNGDGTYSCTATFNELAPTTIPLLAVASSGDQTILSPGFSVKVAAPFSDDDDQEVSDIQNALSNARENWIANGDSAYARILTLQALRSVMQPEPGLTGQPVELCPDGLSIGVRTTSGVVVMFLLNDLSDVVSTAQSASAALRPRLKDAVRIHQRAAHSVKPKLVTGNTSLQCGAPSDREIVQNSSVLIWDPALLFFGSIDSGAPAITKKIQESKCPSFQVDTVAGPQANLASINNFPNYGTIVINTHGGFDPNNRGLFMTAEAVTTGLGALFSKSVSSTTSDFAVSCIFYAPVLFANTYIDTQVGCFFAPYASYITKATTGLSNSIIFGGMCHGADGRLDMAQAFTPPGSNNAYYGFAGLSNELDIASVGSGVFDALIHQHQTAGDALVSAPLPVYGAFLKQFGDSKLAYLGNPKLFSPQAGQDIALALGPGGLLNLQAQLDGASSCDGLMNYSWFNSARQGHLTPADGSGGQDTFTGLASLTTYKADPNAIGVDSVLVDFLPDPADPPAARACTAPDVTTGQVLRFVFDGSGEWYDEIPGTDSSRSAVYTWHAAWEVTLSTKGLVMPQGAVAALPGGTVIGDTSVVQFAGITCNGKPVINTNHGAGGVPLPQSPYLGLRLPVSNSTLVPMWVETFGGYDYHLCDGFSLATTGNYDPLPSGYPSSDTSPGIVMFNLDLSEWLNQPDHSKNINFPSSLASTLAGGYTTGQTQLTSGSLTITSKTILVNPGPSASRITKASQ